MAVPITETEEFKKLAGELYKRNLDLFNANRTLIILQKLYAIMASSLEMPDMAQKFLDTIVTEMNFLSGTVLIRYGQEEFLRPVALSRTPANLEALKLLNVDFSKVQVSLNDNTNIAAIAYSSRQRKSTNSLQEVLTFVTEREKVTKIEQITGIKSTVAYPIVFGPEALGVFLVSMNVEEANLSQTDNNILDRVATVFGIAIDRLTIYVNLQIANNKLKELDAQKDEFLSVASHELRAPMTAIKGYLSMAQDGDGGVVPDEAKSLLNEATTETERMIRLVNNMLNVARIEEGRMVFEQGEVNLTEVVKRVFNEFKFEAEGKSLNYVYMPPDNIMDRVVVDVDRIHEVVANLINNAIKYTDSGGITVRLSNPTPERIRFEVEDTGPGMTPDEVGKLFNKFYRTESYVGKKMGTGLGLYISKLLVQKFGGQIGVNSEKGKGSMFWFELPVKK